MWLQRAIIEFTFMLKTSGVIFEEKRETIRRLTWRIVRLFGHGLIVAALAGILITFWPVISAELNFRISKNHNKDLNNRQSFSGFSFLLAQNEYEAAINQDFYETQKLATQFNIQNTNFSLYIPKINARAPVISNVDPSNPEAMKEALMRGVAHAAGSRFPGIDGATYLFAHSTDVAWNVSQYNAIFYLLRELEPNDEIYVFFLNKAYKYKVSQKHVTAANDTSWLTKSSNGSQRLILQTCWPPGTTWKRLIIVAEPVLTD
ncbi:sortase [Candidatus Microgenomates bacterium]|nr:sortase [Candidatus Microgenomates bacterium]